MANPFNALLVVLLEPVALNPQIWEVQVVEDE
jgi:hypothetical protein